MSNWKKYRLGDIVELNYGKSLTANKRIPGKIPVYSSSGITGSHNLALVDGPSIIVGRKGTVGSVFYNDVPFYCIDTAYYILPNEKKYNLKFLYYLLETAGLQNLNEDSAVPGLNRNTAYNQEVLLPGLPTQTRIASILSSLDDKIELNRRMNHTLEQMAQALFNHYFVDNIDSDNLPERWRIVSLQDIISIKHGYAFKGEFFTEDQNENILLTPGNFKVGGGFNYKKYKYYKGDIPVDYVLNTNDLIVTMTDLSKDGDTLGYSSLVPKIPNKKLLHNQRIGKVIFKGNNNLNFYLYWVLRSDIYRSFVLGSATGTTVKHTSPSRICEYKCVIPPDEIINLFTKQAQTFYEMELANEIQSYTLAETRDTLLPKLMSGEIDLSALPKEELVQEEYL